MTEVVYVTWKKAVQLCYRLAKKIANSRYRPDAVVSIMRGGVVPALVVSDILNVDSFYAVRVKHWGIAEELYPVPVIEQLPQGKIENKRVLLVDEVADTGKTLEVALRELSKLAPREIRTAVLHLKPTSVVTPDYYAEKLEKWIWIFYPWSLAETLIALSVRELKSGDAAESELLEASINLARKLGIKASVTDILKMSIEYYAREIKESRRK
ncbi:MAG: phosphoribosyltransferase [Sulfolobales archaeon]|nr:phosphoribosyltransferase [Sulfolobales archaeon]MDW8082745.1 phosphoribosyltransferase [Sulfolobales archaeon]